MRDIKKLWPTIQHWKADSMFASALSPTQPWQPHLIKNMLSQRFFCEDKKFREFIVNNGVGADGYIHFLNSIVVLKKSLSTCPRNGGLWPVGACFVLWRSSSRCYSFWKMGTGRPKGGKIMKFVIGGENICHIGDASSIQSLKQNKQLHKRS